MDWRALWEWGQAANGLAQFVGFAALVASVMVRKVKQRSWSPPRRADAITCAERALNKLARTFTTQVETLKKYRTGGEQKVTVNDNARAIVENVSTGAAKKAKRLKLVEKVVAGFERSGPRLNFALHLGWWRRHYLASVGGKPFSVPRRVHRT
jgi:hypothetical protein